MLPFLAIYRQIRDFGLLFGDGKFELAMYRQSPNFRDFEPQNRRFWQNSRKPGEIGDFKAKEVIFGLIFSQKGSSLAK